MDVRIGHLTLQPHRQLTEDGKRVALGRKALDLLSVLAHARGSVVSKDELMEAVWPGVIVEENAIQVHMAAVRRALGEAAAALVTIRGIGYQLLATSTSASAMPAPASNKPLLAVLVFENQSPDPDLRFFAEGVSEDILLATARIEGVRVIARTSSFQVQGMERRPKALAATMGATHVLDGSVRRHGERIRIAAQLAQTDDETILWSDGFDGGLQDIFSLQEQIAGAVAAALRRRFSPAPARRIINPLALDLYLQGRQLSGAEQYRRQCIDFYEAALEIQPDYWEAWASLAVTLAAAARWDNNAAPYAELEPQVRHAAAMALSLNADAASAQVALSILEPFACFARREDYFGGALASEPANPEVLRQYAEFLYAVGRIREASALVEEAWQKDPLNYLCVENHASILFELGLKTESYETYRFARHRWPDIWWFHFEPILLASFDGDWPMVDALLAEKGADRPELAIARNVAATLRSRSPEAAAQALATIEARLNASGHADPSSLIFLHVLGFREEVCSMIERSRYDYLFTADGRGRNGIGFQAGIIFNFTAAEMRSDPRFVHLCGKLGLCDYWAETDRWPDCADEVPYDFRAEAAGWLKDRR